MQSFIVGHFGLTVTTKPLLTPAVFSLEDKTAMTSDLRMAHTDNAVLIRNCCRSVEVKSSVVSLVKKNSGSDDVREPDFLSMTWMNVVMDRNA